MTESAKAWSQPNAVEYYAEHRHHPDDVYPSERVFLPRVLFPGAKVLDVGCASGGFFNIMRSIEPAIDYTGIDIAEPSINVAREKYPEARFEVTDGLTMPFADGACDLVHCTSVLVIEPRYRALITEMYRVSNRFVLVDIRLLKDARTMEEVRKAQYRMQFAGEFEGVTVPYVICDADEVIDFTLTLTPSPQAVRGSGYFHTVSAMADTSIAEVCMAMLLIQKPQGDVANTELDLGDLPIAFNATQARQRV
ncbi:MAG: class I SAM-dependent methyltransferase [Candidatus Tectomicrobia bacterium]